MRKINSGQRWKWTYPEHEHIVEVMPDDESAKVIQIIGDFIKNSLVIKVGLIRKQHYQIDFDNFLWEYLEGQDKPND